jgi:hypothetical protein
MTEIHARRFERPGDAADGGADGFSGSHGFHGRRRLLGRYGIIDA